MPKLKTYKAASKRFKYTGSGKLMRTKIGKSHLRRRKSKRVRSMFDEMHVVTAKGVKNHLRRLIPYAD